MVDLRPLVVQFRFFNWCLISHWEAHAAAEAPRAYNFVVPWRIVLWQHVFRHSAVLPKKVTSGYQDSNSRRLSWYARLLAIKPLPICIYIYIYIYIYIHTHILTAIPSVFLPTFSILIFNPKFAKIDYWLCKILWVFDFQSGTHLISLSLCGGFHSWGFQCSPPTLGFHPVSLTKFGEQYFNFAILHDLEQRVKFPTPISDRLWDTPNILDFF